MEKILNDYLEKVEKYLKPLPVSERADIVKEIESEMHELQGNGKKAEEIIRRLGNPKELAKAYLGNLIVESRSFSWSRLLAICAYYSLAGLSGVIVIPPLVICAPVFILCGIATPVLGVLKLIDTLLNLGIPYAVNIGVYGVQNPFIVFAVCVITGALLYLAGVGCWKLLVCYIKGVRKVKNTLDFVAFFLILCYAV